MQIKLKLKENKWKISEKKLIGSAKKEVSVEKNRQANKKFILEYDEGFEIYKFMEI